MVATGGKILAADINAIINAALNRPLVRLVQQAAQSIASGTDVALTFGAGSEDIDTHGFHDTATNTSRITPTLAGYYQFTGNVWWSTSTTLLSYHSAIARNGSVVARNRIVMPTGGNGTRSHLVSAVLAANGTTDYFELIGQQAQSPTAALSTNVAGSFSSTFECVFLRPL